MRLFLLITYSAFIFEGLCCPEEEYVDKILRYFKADEPKGIPGLNITGPVPLVSPLEVGVATLFDTHVTGLEEMQIHSFGIYAHTFNASAVVSFPFLNVFGVYEIPGIWWTTTGNYSVVLTDIKADVKVRLAVLQDYCFYATDYETTISYRNMTYSTDGLFDDSMLVDFYFSSLFDLLVNITKPTILDIANENIRYVLSRFLPPELKTDTEGNITIPSEDVQIEALQRFVSYQIFWIFGDPYPLPDVILNIMRIVELHDISVYGLSRVVDIERLVLEYDGKSFYLSTYMLHNDVYNKHHVLWFPGTFLKKWQWTEAKFGLIKQKAKLTFNRTMDSRPELTEFTMRPVLFNPNHRSSVVRTLDRAARKFLDATRTSLRDLLQMTLYSPLRERINKMLVEVHPESIIKNFVCYAIVPENEFVTYNETARQWQYISNKKH